MQLVAADAAYKTVKTVGRVATIKKSDYGRPIIMGRLCRLALTRWTGWSAFQVGRHVKCGSQTTYPVNRGSG